MENPLKNIQISIEALVEMWIEVAGAQSPPGLDAPGRKLARAKKKRHLRVIARKSEQTTCKGEKSSHQLAKLARVKKNVRKIATAGENPKRTSANVRKKKERCAKHIYLARVKSKFHLSEKNRKKHCGYGFAPKALARRQGNKRKGTSRSINSIPQVYVCTAEIRHPARVR